MKILTIQLSGSSWFRSSARCWTLGCSLLGGAVVHLAVPPQTLAQRGDDRGGDRGGDRGSDRGSDRGGDRGSRFSGGGFGGPPGGFGGGFGGPPGGGSFSPIDMLKRFDRNSNNMLDPEEMEGPARFFLDRMAQNNPRIDLSKPVPLDRLAGEMDRMRQERGGGSSGSPTAATTTPKEPEPLVPGFDKIEQKEAVQGFGVADENSSIKTEERDLREADERLKRYDSNKDGVLSKEEIQGGRWSDDPMQYDRNRDGKLTKSELAVRYAKRRLGEQGQPQGAANNNNDPRSRMANMSPWGGGSGSSWGGRGGESSGWGGRGGESGGWGSREENRETEKKDDKKEQPKSYRTPSVRDKANNVKGLPDWFARSDADGDGQVMMSEYSPSWTNEKVAEFAKFDLNSDGIVTSRECLQALKTGTSGSTAGTSTSSSSSSSSPAATASIVSASGGSAEDKIREWAKRQIEKYDKNKDNQLTVDEWSSMAIAPDGADVDKNGIITLEEYVKFRSK